MKTQILTCLLKDYPISLGFKFIGKQPEYMEGVEKLNEDAGVIYLHSASEDGQASSTDMLCITFSLEQANFLASKMKIEDFVQS
jgi:hypothetical protein